MTQSGLLRPPGAAEVRSNAGGLVTMGAIALMPGVVASGVRLARGGTDWLAVLLPLAAALALLLLALAIRRRCLATRLYSLPLAVFGLTLAWGLNVLTQDGSIGGLAGLMLPLIYAAHNLGLRPAIVIVVACMAAQLHVSLVYGAGIAFLDNYLMLMVVEAGLTWFIMHSRVRQQQLQSELRRLALIDPLTGLATRRVLDEALQAALTSHPRECALVMFDMDAFKGINDTHGHPVGDSALIMAAAELRAAAREHDVAARVGGDEFALLLVECSGEQAQRRAEQIVSAVAGLQVPVSNGGRVSLSASAGVAHAGDVREVPDVQGLYQAADRSLYSAKRAGRNRVGAR